MPAKKETDAAEQSSAQPNEKQQDGTLAILSMVFGLVSLTGPGLVFGIPAIVLGAIALKRNLPQKGMSLTGLITGIISTLISLLILGFVVFLMAWAASHPEALQQEQQQNAPSQRQTQSERLFDSSHV